MIVHVCVPVQFGIDEEDKAHCDSRGCGHEEVVVGCVVPGLDASSVWCVDRRAGLGRALGKLPIHVVTQNHEQDASNLEFEIIKYKEAIVGICI